MSDINIDLMLITAQGGEFKSPLGGNMYSKILAVAAITLVAAAACVTPPSGGVDPGACDESSDIWVIVDHGVGYDSVPCTLEGVSVRNLTLTPGSSYPDVVDGFIGYCESTPAETTALEILQDALDEAEMPPSAVVVMVGFQDAIDNDDGACSRAGHDAVENLIGSVGATKVVLGTIRVPDTHPDPDGFNSWLGALFNHTARPPHFNPDCGLNFQGVGYPPDSSWFEADGLNLTPAGVEVLADCVEGYTPTP